MPRGKSALRRLSAVEFDGLFDELSREHGPQVPVSAFRDRGVHMSSAVRRKGRAIVLVYDYGGPGYPNKPATWIVKRK